MEGLGRALRALVVAPSEQTRLRYLGALGKRGGTVRVAASTEEASTSIAAERPHLLIVDTQLGDWQALASMVLRSSIRPFVVVVTDANHIERIDSALPLDLVMLRPAADESIAALLNLGDSSERAPDYHSLLGASVLDGPLDQAIHGLCRSLASGLDAKDCLFLPGVDNTASMSQTVPAPHDDDLSRIGALAARMGVPVIAAASNGPPSSFLGGPLTSLAGDELGHLCLVVNGTRLFNHQELAAFSATCRRVGFELGWRATHRRVLLEYENLRDVEHLDPKIGVWNRAATEHLAVMQCASSRREQRPLTFAVFDIMNLQGINEAHGHAVGDLVLRQLADCVREAVRAEDIVGRYDGDEIAIALVGAQISDAERVVSRIIAAVEEHPLTVEFSEKLKVHVTAGLTAFESRWDRAEASLARAAKAARSAQVKDVTMLIADGSGLSSRSDSSGGSDKIGGMTLAGTYRLLHEISRGGMGVVYRAEDISLGRQVAIKMLRPDLANDDKLLKGFRTEAGILAQLHHPNLVQIYAFGTDREDTYFAMELVEGESVRGALDRCIREHTTIPLAKFVSVLGQIASALDALHDNGVIHRDVKPANVVLDPFRSRAVLVDVGIARRHHEGLEPAGTPGYIAPEVLAGEDATARSDLYGLASTSYEMLAKCSPWGSEHEGHALVRAQLGEKPAPLSTHRPELALLDQTFRRALSPVPQSRHASAAEFAKEVETKLRDAVGHEPASSPGPRAAGVARAHLPSDALDDESEVSSQSTRMTRGIVFRSVPRVLGVRQTERWRSSLSHHQPELADALRTDVPPLGWLDVSRFHGLLENAPQPGLSLDDFAMALGKATIRGSFRRFFPASSVTLAPSRTLSSLNIIWSRYQSWGKVMTVLDSEGSMLVRLTDAPPHRLACQWVRGLIEQLVTFSGGRSPAVLHGNCTATGSEHCLFGVTWDHEETSS